MFEDTKGHAIQWPRKHYCTNLYTHKIIDLITQTNKLHGQMLALHKGTSPRFISVTVKRQVCHVIEIMLYSSMRK